MILDTLQRTTLQWTAKKEKLFRQNGEAVPDKVAVIREDDNSYLGTVSKTFGIIQNADCWTIVNECLAKEAVLYKSGELFGGRKVWWALDLGRFDVENLRKFVVLVNSFDGSCRFKAMITTIRPICSNMLNRIGKSAIINLSVKHTVNASIRVHQVQNLFEQATNEYARFTEEIKAMRSRRISHGEFEDYAKSILHMKDENKFAKVITTLKNNMSNDQYLGTMWGAYNAVTQYLEHQRPVRAANEFETRFNNNLFGTVAKMKNAALTLAVGE